MEKNAPRLHARFQFDVPSENVRTFPGVLCRLESGAAGTQFVPVPAPHTGGAADIEPLTERHQPRTAQRMRNAGDELQRNDGRRVDRMIQAKIACQTYISPVQKPIG